MPATIAGHAMQQPSTQSIIQASAAAHYKKIHYWANDYGEVEFARGHGMFNKSFIASTPKSAHQANITGKHGCICTAGLNAQIPFLRHLFTCT